MIRNNRQAAATRKRVRALATAAATTDVNERAGYRHLIDDLTSELSEYDSIQSGRVKTFEVNGIDNLGDALVKARIARGWTHRQLSRVLGVSEQMIQKDEARSYERAGLARLADIADGLGYELTGLLKPSAQAQLQPWQLNQASTSTAVISSNSWVPVAALTLNVEIVMPIYAPWPPHGVTQVSLRGGMIPAICGPDLTWFVPAYSSTNNQDTSDTVVLSTGVSP